MLLSMLKCYFAAMVPVCPSLATQLWPAAEYRNNTFNATYGRLNSDEASKLLRTANLSQAQFDAVLVALEFERSNWAGSAVELDNFYQQIPDNASTLLPGAAFKVEEQTNTSLYTLPGGVALSRFLFTTETLNGTVVPASAYVLWPWLPKSFNNVTGFPVVGWAHGTSGWSGECAPSHLRSLTYQYAAPFVLALQGYVVVAPDLAGIGVDHDAQGNFIEHQYLANPAHGNDLIYAVQAAQTAWPELSEEFVVMGHSQGGSATWGAAEQLTKNSMKGFLGAVTVSPSPSVAGLFETLNGGPLLWTMIAKVATGVQSIFPSFQLSDWLSDEGVRLTTMLQKVQGCQSVLAELLAAPNLERPGWNETWYLPAFDSLTRSGGKEFAGPMLVLHGSAETLIPEAVVSTAVNETCVAVPDSQLQFRVIEGATHPSILFNAQQIWLDWIAARFNKVPVAPGCVQDRVSPAVEGRTYTDGLRYTLQYALYDYELM